MEGLALSELFRGRDIEPMNKMMTERMQEAGLEYHDRSMTYNSRLAQELGKWADTQDGGDAVHGALFRAYFVEHRNLALIDVLVDIAANAGLDIDVAAQVLEQRTFGPQVDKDWQTARELGVTGVPTFLAGNQALVGCQPYEVLEQYIKYVQELSS